MDLGFLGHQSWWIRSGDVTLLVDPVLGATMGHRTRLPIHPPRTIDPAVLLPVDLVVLTHEHNDHTDLAGHTVRTDHAGRTDRRNGHNDHDGQTNRAGRRGNIGHTCHTNHNGHNGDYHHHHVPQQP